MLSLLLFAAMQSYVPFTGFTAAHGDDASVAPAQASADFAGYPLTGAPSIGAMSEAGSQARGSLPPLAELHRLPTTYGQLLEAAILPRCFMAFASKVGMTPMSPFDHVFAVPEEDLVGTINAIVVEGAWPTHEIW